MSEQKIPRYDFIGYSVGRQAAHEGQYVTFADHAARVADLEHRLANCDADLFAMQEAKQAAERKVAALQAFAHDVMTSWPEGDVDGGALQEYAEKHGLIVPQEVMEPCGDDCVCAGYGEFPMTCYRKTDLLQGQPT